MYKYFLRLIFLNLYGLYAINVSSYGDDKEILIPEKEIYYSPISNKVKEPQVITIKSYIDNKCEKIIETNIAQVGECKVLSKLVWGVFLSCNNSMVYGKIYTNSSCEGDEVAFFIGLVKVCDNREIITCSENSDASNAVILFLYISIPIIIVLFAYCYMKYKNK
jgi:hypothetical protein